VVQEDRRGSGDQRRRRKRMLEVDVGTEPQKRENIIDIYYRCQKRIKKRRDDAFQTKLF